jgi:hypothetical protein
MGSHPASPVKKKIFEKPPRNSAGFCGGGQGLSWAVEPRIEEEEGPNNFLYIYIYIYIKWRFCDTDW